MHFSLSKISPACNICNIIYSMHFEHFLFFPLFIFSPKPKEGNSEKIPTLEAQLQSDRAKVTLSLPVIFIRACVDPADC